MSMTDVSPRTEQRLWITALVYLMVQALMFGVPTILALTFFPHDAEMLIPAIVVISALVSLPLSWKLAPRLRARIERQYTRPSEIDPDIVMG